MQFGAFWQTPGFEGSSVSRRHWETVEEVELAERLYDEPAACVDYLQRLREELPGMRQCILEFNRRGRIPSDHVRQSMRLFADEAPPKLS